LAAQCKEHDRIRHLVVEPKAPDVTLSQTELNQVEGYVNTVRTNAAFATEKSSWDFILVATDFDELVGDRIQAEYRDTGQFLAPGAKAGRRPGIEAPACLTNFGGSAIAPPPVVRFRHGS
jgi:hypothetical protein